MINDLKDDRLESALAWCEKHKLKTYLDLNDLQSGRKPGKKRIKGAVKMRNRNTDIVIITDEKDLTFECIICGQVWKPAILTGGRLARGSWQCPKGCKRVGPVRISYL